MFIFSRTKSTPPALWFEQLNDLGDFDNANPDASTSLRLKFHQAYKAALQDDYDGAIDLFMSVLQQLPNDACCTHNLLVLNKKICGAL